MNGPFGLRVKLGAQPVMTDKKMPNPPLGGDDLFARRALLPEGYRDELYPQAEQHYSLVHDLVDVFQSFGYVRVRPPLVEYEETLFAGAGETKAAASFRLMDPATQRPMAVRADMTPQIARIASTRLKDAPRPLRLAYSGTVMRVIGSQIRPTREFMQAGFELVGSDTLASEVEGILVAVEALKAVDIRDLSLDLTVAPLVGLMAAEIGTDAYHLKAVRAALASKDVAALRAIEGGAGEAYAALIPAAGPAATALERLATLRLGGDAGALVDRLAALVAALKSRMPDLSITVDPCETHGFEYKCGIGFALFAAHVRAELGRGGRYMVTHPDGTEEPAVGFSAYLDSLLDAARARTAPSRLYIPCGVAEGAGAKWRADGWRTVRGLADEADIEAEARRLLCTHLLEDGEAVALAR